MIYQKTMDSFLFTRKSFVLIILFISIQSFSQKQIVDYTLPELEQKKKEAVEKDNMSDAAVYKNAISLRTQLDAAKNAEDFEKAASLKEQLKKLKVNSNTNQNADKIKKLEDEIKVAVAAEDYAKASALKKELSVLKGDNSTAKSGTSDGNTEKIKKLETDIDKAVAVEDYAKASALKKELNALKGGSSSANEKSSTTEVNTSGSSVPAIEFVHQVYYWDKGNNSIKALEYDTPEMKTATSGGFGYAKATSFWVIQGPTSDVVLSSSKNNSFLVRIGEGSNPVDLFRLVRFEIKGKNNPGRHMAGFTSTSAAFAGGSTSERHDNDVPINFNKVKDGYYEIVVSGSMVPGEYTFYGLGKMYSFSLN
ncbi:MAG: UvrB/UvrC motif-containing protein [Bacteroidia bacterium]|nr:UvrB/UvrC motif-containing protein [Bacteroidia bacterium]